MADIRKQNFRTVKTDVAELEQKIHKHRKKIVIRIAVLSVLVLVLAASAGIYYNFKEYTGYEVRLEIERSDSEATKYESYAGNILRYNNDGAFYLDASGNLIWNQAFEMQEPAVDICGNYAAVADLRGTQIYIMDTAGTQGEVSTVKPIQAVCVARQGTIAVLTQENGTSYLELYNKSGENLASGQIHITNSGYPLDIALSGDATKLAVSVLDISKGKAQTTVSFYNFASVGQNEIDNMVGTYSYPDTIIPQINFISDNGMLAFGDNRIILFEGAQKPEESFVQEIKEKVKSVFFNTEYYGLVYDAPKSQDSCKAEIYDMKGRLRLEQNFKMSYRDIEFLENHEICIRNENECQIYTLRGVKKFTYEFDDTLYKVFSGGSGRRYTFILDGKMEKVRLK